MRVVLTPPLHTFPALRCAILFIGGILCGRLPLVEALCAVALLLAFLLLARRLPHRSSPAIFVCSAALPSLLIASLGALAISAGREAMPAIPDSLTIRAVTVAGAIATPPDAHMDRTRFLLHAEACFDEGRLTPIGADLMVTEAWMDSGNEALGLAPGMTIALHGWLSLPGPPRNPGEPSLAGYWAANGIAGTFFVHGREGLALVDANGGSWLTRRLIMPLRAAINASADSLIGGEEGEFLKGLLIGERGGMTQETLQAFVAAGVAHVLAVSGSNVAVVALMLGFVAGLLRLPRVVRTALVAAGLLFYMELTGGQTSVVRATIMALIFLAGKAAQRRASAYNSLGLSALLILLWDARQLFDPGFQLSFCAVFGIIHLYPRMNAAISLLRRQTLWARWLAGILRLTAVSLAATLATLPVTASWFGRVSLVGICANIPVVPATGFSVLLGTAAVAGSLAGTWIATSFAALNALLLHATLEVTRLAAAVPFATVDVAGFPAAAGVALCAGIGLLFHWRERGGMRIFLPAFLLALNFLVYIPRDTEARPGILRVHIIDVGQGDAILVELPGGRTMLIDAGPWSPSFDAGERTVGPYLQRLGIGKIDIVLVTHPHSDHLGGAPYLLHQFRVGRLGDSGLPVHSSLYAAYLRAGAAAGIAPEALSAGTTLDAGPEVRCYVLAPLTRFIDRDTSRAPPNLNNASVVVKLQYGSSALLFAGDAEEIEEDVMVRQYGAFLGAAFLKAGHHGSITSSSVAFIDAVHPGVVAVSVGRRNRFHHPSPAVLERFASRGAQIARTDRDGAIIVETDGVTLRRITWR